MNKDWYKEYCPAAWGGGGGEKDVDRQRWNLCMEEKEKIHENLGKLSNSTQNGSNNSKGFQIVQRMKKENMKK